MEEKNQNQSSPKLTHLDDEGAARIVDVSEKSLTVRKAVAVAQVKMSKEALRLAREGGGKKGEVFQVARIAGIMAAKKTSELIPLCHILNLSSVKVDFSFPNDETVGITCTAKVTGPTGVEMEALTGATVAGLTIYDMLKGVDKRMVLSEVHLVSKTGGKSGDFQWDDES